ncbi:hypothetical protein BE20_29625 [Sorangium cellulosum]|nr:hypothetical protein BE20_29625 [Sorangium cellulosum]
MRRARQLVQHDEGRRHHVVGHLLPQRPPELLRRHALGGGDVGDQPPILRPILAHDRDRAAHAGVLGEPRLDLASFTWWSTRPANSSCPSARHRARSPVRYIRSPGRPANGSGTKRSAVSPGRAQ